MTRQRENDRNGSTPRDVPTNLFGAVDVEADVMDGDDLCADERAALHAALDRALDDSQAGRMMDAWAFLEAQRARRHQSAR